LVGYLGAMNWVCAIVAANAASCDLFIGSGLRKEAFKEGGGLYIDKRTHREEVGVGFNFQSEPINRSNTSFDQVRSYT